MIIQYPANTNLYETGRACGSGSIKGIVLIPVAKDIEQLLQEAKNCPIPEVASCFAGYHFAYDPVKDKLYQFVAVANTAFTFDQENTACELESTTPLLTGELGGVSPNCTAVTVAIATPKNRVREMIADCDAVGTLTDEQLNNLGCRVQEVLTAAKTVTGGLTNSNIYAYSSESLNGTGSDRGKILGVDLEDILAEVCVAELTLEELLVARSAEIVTATNVISATENGKTFFLDSATEFVSTLPAPSLGLKFTFIVKTAPTGASYTIVTASSANVIKGHVLSSDLNAAGDSDFEVSGGDTISFVDGKAVAGDRVDLVSDGTSWFAHASCTVFDAITITTAS